MSHLDDLFCCCCNSAFIDREKRERLKREMFLAYQTPPPNITCKPTAFHFLFKRYNMWFLLFLCFVRRSCCSDPASGCGAQPDLRKKRSHRILPWSWTVCWWKVRARRFIFNFCWLLTELDEKCALFQEDIIERRQGKKRENHRHTHTLHVYCRWLTLAHG